MQEDFKNQLQNTMALWRKKGQQLVEDILLEAKNELRMRLSQKGVTEKWTSLVNFVEEMAPDLAPQFATLLSSKLDPLSQWLDLRVKKWEPYRIEIFVGAKEHLLEGVIWHTSSMIALSETAARWLIEKHSPLGDFKMKVKGVEVTHTNFYIESQDMHNCLARCELDSSDFENHMAQLLSKGQVDFSLPVMILGENDVLLSQVHFHFEFQWKALLK